MKNYKIKWHAYSLFVSCKKCGNNMPFGNFDGHPECDECSYVMPEDWVSVLKFVEVQSIKKESQGNKTILGKFQARSHVEPSKPIRCNKCDHELIITESSGEDLNPTCSNCNSSLPLKRYDAFPDLLFYGQYVHKNKVKSKTPIVLQCFSCASPLKVVNDVVQLHCEACGNDNVMTKPSANEKIFSDIFVGVKVETFPASRINEKSPEIVRKALVDNKREDFSDEELNAVLKRFPDSEGVYNAVHFNIKYQSNSEVYQFLWDNSKKVDILRQVGKRLNKSQEEIQKRIEQFYPKKDVSSKNNPSKKEGAKQGSINWIGVVIFLVSVLIIIALTIFKTPEGD